MSKKNKQPGKHEKLVVDEGKISVSAFRKPKAHAESTVKVYGNFRTPEQEKAFMDKSVQVFANTSIEYHLYVTVSDEMLTVAASKKYGGEWEYSFTQYHWMPDDVWAVLLRVPLTR